MKLASVTTNRTVKLLHLQSVVIFSSERSSTTEIQP